MLHTELESWVHAGISPKDALISATLGGARLLGRESELGTDVLGRPRCGGTRRVVAVVLRSSTAQAILEHLRLLSRPLPLAPATSPPQLGFW